LLVQDRSGYVAQQTRLLDRVVVFVELLLLLAVVITVLGVVVGIAAALIPAVRAARLNVMTAIACE
jgi:putative ABC transport system permease protein